MNAIACLLLAVFLVGCASRQNPYFGPASAPFSPSTPMAAPETVAVTGNPAVVVGQDVLESDAPLARARGVTNTGLWVSGRWGAGWVPLDRWAEESGIARPDRHVLANTTRYMIPTRRGVCALTMDSRLAKWNGVSIWLGFAPQFIRGKPHVHASDLEKTLQPLADGPPVELLRARTIVIDPGHGGADSGTRGARGEQEKDFTLDWALRLETLLTNTGWKVALTRRADMDVPLAERVNIADRAAAQLFLSLHFNSAHPNTGPSGIETYCLTPVGMPSTLLRNYADETRMSFPNNAFDEANLQYAYRIHESLVSRTGAIDQGVKRARFMSVLRAQQRPAVLIEGGFLSNPAEGARIQSPAYRQQLAAAVADALNAR